MTTVYRIANKKKQLIIHEATSSEEQPDEQLPLSISIKEIHEMCTPKNQVNNHTIENNTSINKYKCYNTTINKLQTMQDKLFNVVAKITHNQNFQQHLRQMTQRENYL